MGEQWTWVEIGNSLMPMLLFPVFLFMPLAILMKRWKLLLVNLPLLCVFGILYLPFFIPKQPVRLEALIPLRLLTFNLGSYIQDEAQFVTLIRSVDADIVAVQELLPSETQTITEALSAIYPYQALHPIEVFARGVGIFSKYPIQEDQYLSNLSLGGQRTRIAYRADSVFTVFNVHPTSPRIIGGFDSSLRRSEIDYVLQIASDEIHPTLLVGDFNITDQTDDYTKLKGQYGDAFLSAGQGFGFSFPDLGQFSPFLNVFPPLLRIDFVFYSVHWTALRAYVLQDNGGSDHYPLWVEIGLKTADR